MPIQDLKGQISRLPEQPGVYLYSNGAGETLYVGKAKVLRDRVRSYLGAHGISPRIDALLNEAEQLEVIVTDSVVEALALENHLIKQRSPKYNILLRDDKNYPYLQLTRGETFPRVVVARRVDKDEHFYAGPFLPASLARKTMSLTHKLFGLRSCSEVITGLRGRPCLEYDIKRCAAPCVREICSEDEYRVRVEHTQLFLEGRNDELVQTLKARMIDAASEEQFERAAQLRDAIRTIETLRTRQQKMATAELGDRDAFGIKLGPPGAVVQVFQVRGGKVVERVELVTEASGLRLQPEAPVALAATGEGEPNAPPVRPGERPATAIASEAEVLQAALQQFYADRVAAPEVHLPVEFSPADTEMLEGWLSAGAERRVRICVPRRGEKRGLLDLAARNAAVAYQARFNENVAANYDALETLRAVLNLPSLPRRIECFDISTIQGSETVASMVVCEDGRMKRSEYRKFKIRPDEIGRRQRSTRSTGLLIHREGAPGTAAPATLPSGAFSTVGGGTDETESLSRAVSGDSEWREASPAPAAPASSESSSRAAGAGGAEDPPRAVPGDLERTVASPAPAVPASSESSSRAAGAGGAEDPPRAVPGDLERTVASPAPAAPASSESSSRAAGAGGGGAPPALILDDFAAMHQVVLRRYRKLLEGGGPFPDLILIDGGKGQLSAAYEALTELGLSNLVAVGIAKKEELLFTRDLVDGIALPRESPTLLLIQRIRDEAHRFAVTFHRQSRTKRDLRSEVDQIGGVGPRRRKALLTAFGSVAGVRRAAREDLVRVVGAKCADAVLAHFAATTGT